ncbi:MAG: efflux RND transporter periplasmic adaptor subunit [Acidobacteriota bacterium]
MKHRRLLIASVLVLVSLLAAAAWWVSRERERSAAVEVPRSISPPAKASVPAVVVVQLDGESAKRAEIQTAAVETRPVAQEIRAPGTVEPNQYRNVTVSSIVAGTVTAVTAKLGDFVGRGRSLATISSKEVAEAQRAYVTAAAMVEADHKRVVRTEKLLAIGAASRQELEAVQAEHAEHASELESARERLLQMGINAATIAKLTSATAIGADISVASPIAGTVLERKINLGQVISEGVEMFTVTDLSTVWVVGNLYEQNFRDVRIGSRARITTVAYPGRKFYGRVSYIDPQVNPETRTSRVRVEVSNPAGRFRLNMFVELSFEGKGDAVVSVPEEAVQFVGDLAVVYQPDPKIAGTFLQKRVELGNKGAGFYEVLGGLQSGGRVVTKGSFILRSESLRMNPQQ